MRKLILILTAASMILSAATPASSEPRKYEVNQKTLATFSSYATGLTSQQKAQVRAAVEANPDAEKFICTGIRYYSQPMSVNIMVRKRAKAACEYAKQLNPELSTWYQNKPTKARSYAGKVLLTIKSPVIQNHIAQSAYAELDALRDNSASVPSGMVLISENLPEFHVEPLYQVTRDAMSMFDEQYSLPVNYKLIAFTESDFEWADQKLVEYNGQLPDGSWSQAWINTGQADGHCWMAINSNGNTHFCMATNPRTASEQYNTVAHEYFHNIQMGPLGMSPVRTPIWITEGGAEYFGWAITDRGSEYTLNKLAGWQTRYLSETYGGQGFKDYIKNMPESDFVAGMTAMEVGSIAPTSRDAGQKFAMYKLGAAANEYLVGKYSYSTYMSFLEAIGNGGQPWAAAFSSHFGLTPAEFYSDLYRYLDVAY